MKVLLDENITQKSIPVLEKYGHNVIHVLDRYSAGESDETVFQLALNERRVLITLNGKDFIIFIPPVADLPLHYGLIWLRGFQVTKKSYEKVMDIIGSFLEIEGDSVKNTYYAMKKNNDSYDIVKRFPVTKFRMVSDPCKS